MQIFWKSFFGNFGQPMQILEIYRFWASRNLMYWLVLYKSKGIGYDGKPRITPSAQLQPGSAPFKILINGCKFFESCFSGNLPTTCKFCKIFVFGTIFGKKSSPYADFSLLFVGNFAHKMEIFLCWSFLGNFDQWMQIFWKLFFGNFGQPMQILEIYRFWASLGQKRRLDLWFSYFGVWNFKNLVRKLFNRWLVKVVIMRIIGNSIG